jgi:hypothetical protein
MHLNKVQFIISILTLLLGAIVNSSAQTTNVIPPNLFLTDNGFLFWFGHTRERLVDINKIKEAKASKESRPADQDVEGHWGQATNGFQLSLRFEKGIFSNGEPVVAVTLMRNITNQPQNYFRPVYIVATKDGKPLKRKDNKDINVIEITISPKTTLFPQTQKREIERLDQIYDLAQSGEYLFRAECRYPEVASKQVSVLITNFVQVK